MESGAIMQRIIDEFDGKIQLNARVGNRKIPLFAETPELLHEFWGRVLQSGVCAGLVGACGTPQMFERPEDMPWETVYCRCDNPHCILIQIGKISESDAHAMLCEEDEEETGHGLAVGNMQFAPEINIKMDNPLSGIPMLAVAAAAFVVGRLTTVRERRLDLLSCVGVGVAAYFVGNLQRQKK